MAGSDKIFVVHNVHCLARGDVAVMLRACCWIMVDSIKPTRSRYVLRGTRAARNRFEAYACGNETSFADRGRPIGQTVGPVPLGWC